MLAHRSVRHGPPCLPALEASAPRAAPVGYEAGEDEPRKSNLLDCQGSVISWFVFWGRCYDKPDAAWTSKRRSFRPKVAAAHWATKICLARVQKKTETTNS